MCRGGIISDLACLWFQAANRVGIISDLMCLCFQAASSDILRAGEEPGTTGGVLLHAGGLLRPGENGQHSSGEPQAAACECCLPACLPTVPVHSKGNQT